MRNRLTSRCVLFLFLGLLASNANAALIYRIDFGQANYTVSPGGTVDVDIFLYETADAGETPLIVTGGNDGLGALGATVVFGNGLSVGPLDAYTFPDIQTVLPDGTFVNPIFTTQNVVIDNRPYIADQDNDAFTASLSGAAADDTVIEVPLVVGQTSYQLQLGTIRFTATGAPGDQIGLSFSPKNFDVLYSPDVSDEKVAIYGFSNISITSVPEPSSIALGLVGLSGILYRRLRLKRCHD